MNRFYICLMLCIRLIFDGLDSIMGLLMLAASIGTCIEVETRGPDAEPLLAVITALVADKFGEGD